MPKAGVSNDRFSAKVKLWCKLDIHIVILSASVYLRRRVGLQCFQREHKDFECFKNVSTFTRSPAGSKISRNQFFYINLSVFFSSKWNGSGWAQKVTDESLPATAPSAHSGFSKGRLRLHVMIIMIETSVYKFPNGEAMAQWQNRALIDLRVAGSNPAGQLLIYFHNVFPVLTKTLCQHPSLVPRSRIKAFMRKPRRCSTRPSPPPPPPPPGRILYLVSG